MMMGVRVLKILKRLAVLLAISAITLLAIRAYDSQRGQPLEPWHTYVPHELSVKELDHVGWTEYLKAEDAVFEGVRSEVTQKLDRKTAFLSTAILRVVRSIRAIFARLEPFVCT